MCKNITFFEICAPKVHQNAILGNLQKKEHRRNYA